MNQPLLLPPPPRDRRKLPRFACTLRLSELLPLALKLLEPSTKQAA